MAQGGAYRVRQASQRIRKGEDELWTWQAWLEGAGLEGISRVVYTLHPCFPNPNRVVRQPSQDFRLSVGPDEATWGAFTLRVRIIGKDGSIDEQALALELQREDGSPAPALLALPADATPEATLKLAGRLKSKGAFGYARTVLERAWRHPELDQNPGMRERVIQQRALCTYKDEYLPLDQRLDEALPILNDCRDTLAGSNDPETLGIAGAIHKRMWEVGARREELERSYGYYRRGYEAATRAAPEARDAGAVAYTGINASFILDLLGNEECRSSGLGLAGVVERHAEARRIRSELVQTLEAAATDPSQQDWWIWATLAEAHLGLAAYDPGHYSRAEEAIGRGMSGGGGADWERESTYRQLMALGDLLTTAESGVRPGIDRERALAVVDRLVPGTGRAPRGVPAGKLGLALSGGGFRASLFHIGVLARLAELDLLRHVEAISCVSGGSILGAHYYLKLRQLLQQKPDGDIGRDDYVRLVQETEREFLAGVQTNIRVSLAASLRSNVRMLLSPSRYSRTERLGELYEERLYSRIMDGEGEAERWLNDLFVEPVARDPETGELQPEAGFSPKAHNWRRGNKVPILILNATSLNTGHTWQFTASWMGEAASATAGQIDKNDLLQRCYYCEAPDGHRSLRLGHAVAASACVPGLFDPLVLDGLYPERIVRLVDGGVHDNQGIQGLLDQGCNLLLVSDASGQMGSVANPPKGAIGVLLRANSILQARVRGAQYQDLVGREQATLVKGKLFVHLKQGLERAALSAACQETETTAHSGGERPVAQRTPHGVMAEVQGLLSELRTDLDSFSDLEAFSLMTSGYRASELALEEAPALRVSQDQRAPWRFLAVDRLLRGEDPSPGAYPRLLQHLQIGRALFFKVWLLSPQLKRLALGSGLVALLALLWYVVSHWNDQWSLSLSWSLGGLLLAVILMLLPKVLSFAGGLGRWLGRTIDLANYRETLVRVGVGVLASTVGALLAWIHLELLDQRFLELGRVRAEPTPAVPLRVDGSGELEST